MCQCGQNRPPVAARTVTNGRAASVHAPRVVAAPTIRYEYTGKTGLTVFGGVTRRRYRFASSGAQVSVDLRDGASLDRVPILRRVSSPAPSGVEL
jgi:hypothetical protein